MTNLETLNEAAAAAEHFSRTWEGTYLGAEVTEAAVRELLADFAKLGFVEQWRSGKASYSVGLWNAEIAVGASITFDRAGGDGPRATAWASVYDADGHKARLTKAAAVAKGKATREAKKAAAQAAGIAAWEKAAEERRVLEAARLEKLEAEAAARTAAALRRDLTGAA